MVQIYVNIVISSLRLPDQRRLANQSVAIEFYVPLSQPLWFTFQMRPHLIANYSTQRANGISCLVEFSSMGLRMYSSRVCTSTTTTIKQTRTKVANRIYKVVDMDVRRTYSKTYEASMFCVCTLRRLLNKFDDDESATCTCLSV